jgi:hypothetical protein
VFPNPEKLQFRVVSFYNCLGNPSDRKTEKVVKVRLRPIVRRSEYLDSKSIVYFTHVEGELLLIEAMSASRKALIRIFEMTFEPQFIAAAVCESYVTTRM